MIIRMTAIAAQDSRHANGSTMSTDDSGMSETAANVSM
jgi:hypothetical protein